MASQHKPANTVCSEYQKTLTASAVNGVHCREMKNGKGDSRENVGRFSGKRRAQPNVRLPQPRALQFDAPRISGKRRSLPRDEKWKR